MPIGVSSIAIPSARGGTSTARALGLWALAALLGCDGHTTAPPATTKVVVTGRLERGSTIEIYVIRGADSSIAQQATVSFSPSDFAEASFVGNRFLLKRAGQATVTVNADAATTTVTATIDVTAPPKILFDMVAAGNRDVYRASLDGQDLERLTTDAGVDVHPSGAKGKLVFTSYRTGNAELFTLAAAAGAPDVALSSTAANETDAVLSPDGTSLAYVRDDGGAPRAWVANADNSAAAKLTAATFGFGGSVEGSPTWRFTSDSLGLMATAPGNASIFVSARTPASTPAQAAKPATTDSVYVEPTWSADGKAIAYTAGADGGSSRIAVLTRATNKAVFVTPATMSTGHPSFLADGRIVFTIFATGGATSLAWVDPLEPGIVHSIPLSGTDPQHPAIIWP